MQFTPFTIAVPDEAIDDLRARLEGTRWPVATTTDWSHGQPVPFIREIAEQWRKTYDWRKHEAALDRKSTRLNSSHVTTSRMPSSA